MSAALEELLELLDLEQVELDIYRGGRNQDIGSGRVFGGQALAQGLVAARRTMDEDRIAHSLHAYFILPGDIEVPIVYFVDRLRDGKSFSTRRVTAIQHGRAIFNLAVSFQIQEEGPEHQIAMPDVPPPEELQPEIEMLREMADRIPEDLREIYTRDRPVEIRPVDPVDPFRPERREPVRHAWIRAMGSMPEEQVQHQAVLAYTSDYGLLGTALLPHGLTFQNPRLQAATLDHALWFHRPVRLDDWLLYTTDAPVTAGARGFTRGSIFTRDGTLVASTAQEGLLRLHG